MNNADSIVGILKKRREGEGGGGGRDKKKNSELKVLLHNNKCKVDMDSLKLWEISKNNNHARVELTIFKRVHIFTYMM